MRQTMRAVVVLPFVPVIAAIGMRLGVPAGKSMFDYRPGYVARSLPSDWVTTCIRKPGAGIDFADPAAPRLGIGLG